MRSPGVMRMKYRRIRPAAYAISLCPPSTSTSNIALGSACETTASITTACSFWSPSSRSGLRTFSGRRGPRRCALDFPKTRDSLLGRDCRGQSCLDRLGQIRRHAIHHCEAAQCLDPAVALLADNLRHELAAAIHVAIDGYLESGPKADLDHLRS